VGVEGRVGLGDDKFILGVGREVFHIIRDEGGNENGSPVQFGNGRKLLGGDALALLDNHFAGVGVGQVLANHAVNQTRVGAAQGLDDTAIGGFDEAVFVDASKRGQTANQTDVRAFRSFNGADAAIV